MGATQVALHDAGENDRVLATHVEPRVLSCATFVKRCSRLQLAHQQHCKVGWALTGRRAHVVEFLSRRTGCAAGIPRFVSRVCPSRLSLCPAWTSCRPSVVLSHTARRQVVGSQKIMIRWVPLSSVQDDLSSEVQVCARHCNATFILVNRTKVFTQFATGPVWSAFLRPGECPNILNHISRYTFSLRVGKHAIP